MFKYLYESCQNNAEGRSALLRVVEQSLNYLKQHAALDPFDRGFALDFLQQLQDYISGKIKDGLRK